MFRAEKRVQKLSMSWLALCGFCVAGFAWSVLAAEPGFRIWSDSSGKFTIKAKLVSLKDGVVTLARENGTELRLPLTKLSAADQKEAQKPVEDDSENPFTKKSDNPFTPKTASPFTPKAESPFKVGKKSAGKKSGKAASPFGKRALEPVVLPIDFEIQSDDQVVSVIAPVAQSPLVKFHTATKKGWQLELPAPPKEAEFSVNPKSVPLPPKQDHEALQSLVVNPRARKAVLGYYVSDPWKKEKAKQSRIVVADLSTGTALCSSSIPNQYRPLALSDDGNTLLVHKYPVDHETAPDPTCELWKLDGTNAVSRISWAPFLGETFGQVAWGDFVGPDMLAVCSGDGTIGIWKTDGLQQIFHIKSTHFGLPAVSPDRKLIAYSDGEQVHVVNVEKREVVASNKIAKALERPLLAFSPTGKQIACVASTRVLMWDTTTGKQLGEIECLGHHIMTKIQVPNDNFVLAANRFLFNVPEQAQLWQYRGHDDVECVGGWSFNAVGHTDAKKQGLLLAIQIPHLAIKEMQDRLLKDPSLLILREGTVVKLDVSALPDPAERAKVAASLTSKLEKDKFKIGDSGTITLFATFDGPKEEIVSYSGAGQYKFKSIKYGVKYVFDGATVWETWGWNTPLQVWQSVNQTFEQALKHYEKPDYKWYHDVGLPKYLKKPSGGRFSGAREQSGFGLGESTVTTTGMK